jgi:hypothetical protein
MSKKAATKQKADIGAIVASMPPEFQAALNAYAAAKGKNWVQKLADDWHSGRDASFPEYGHILRQIRNSPEHGHALMDTVDDA